MERAYWELACRQQGGATLINHRHSNPDSYEIIQVLSGEGTAFIQDRTYCFAPGTLLLIDAACLHCLTPFDVDGYNRNKLIIDKQYLNGIFNAMHAADMPHMFFGASGGGSYYLTAAQARRADTLFSEMERTPDIPVQSLKIISGLMGILMLCADADAPAPPSQDDKLAPALAYLRLHYAEPISVDDIAAGSHISKFYLCRMFRKNTGLTIMEYLYELRLSEARRLLADTELPISAVAQNCGFGSSSHFCTMFKRREGISPKEYRRNK